MLRYSMTQGGSRMVKEENLGVWNPWMCALNNWVGRG
jgi:hypothetical protein